MHFCFHAESRHRQRRRNNRDGSFIRCHRAWRGLRAGSWTSRAASLAESATFSLHQILCKTKQSVSEGLGTCSWSSHDTFLRPPQHVAIANAALKIAQEVASPIPTHNFNLLIIRRKLFPWYRISHEKGSEMGFFVPFWGVPRYASRGRIFRNIYAQTRNDSVRSASTS